MLRALVTSILVHSALPAYAQSRADLRARYSAPVRETYEIRPGVLAEVTFDARGQACTVEISPKRTPGDPADPSFDPKIVDALVDEFAPPEMRGADLGSVDAEFGAPGAFLKTYERASVTLRTFGPKRAVTSIGIGWRDRSCE